MTDPTTQLDLDAIQTAASNAARIGSGIDPGVATALIEENRRLRAELARRVQCNDCGAVGEVFTGVDGLAYLDPSGQIGHHSARPAPTA